MKHTYTAQLDNVMIRPIEVADIELFRKWRNDPSITVYLRKIGNITKEMQKQWFDNYLNDSSEMFFAIEETDDLNRLVGSLALYHLESRNNECEIGKILIGDPEAHGRGIGRKSFVMAMKIGFQELGMQKIVVTVNPENIPSYRNIIKTGFCITGEVSSAVSGKELLLGITEDKTREHNPFYDEIIVKVR